jgi:rod shape-determining protein MreB and related proteins
MGLFSIAHDVAIDLGTANTLIYIKGQGIVLSEPSIVALHRTTRKVIAVGREAQQMHERTHKDIETIRPLKDGVIADFEVAEQMIRGLIQKVQKSWLSSIRRMVVCVPSGITEVEKRAVRDSAEHAGAKQAFLIDEPMAAAIGIGLDVSEPVGNMIVDIGGGTSEIAVIALSGIVVDESIRVGGDEFDDAIVQFFRRNHNMLVGHRTAERIKCEIGSAVELEQELELTIRGRNLVSGIPKVHTVTSEDVREALKEGVQQITAAVVRCLERTPPELGSDILERGIMLTGGGALLKGLDQHIRNRVDLPVYVAEDPLTAVVRGTGKVLEDIEGYKRVLT